jgi:hypothetical protein
LISRSAASDTAGAGALVSAADVMGAAVYSEPSTPCAEASAAITAEQAMTGSIFMHISP